MIDLVKIYATNNLVKIKAVSNVVKILGTPNNVLIKAQNNLVQIKAAQNNVMIKMPGVQGPPGVPGLPGSGGGMAAYTAVAADYWAAFVTDGWIDASCDSGDLNIWLPIANPANKTQAIFVKKADTSPYVVHVKTQVGQAIDNGITDFQIYQPYGLFAFMSTGAAYRAF